MAGFLLIRDDLLLVGDVTRFGRSAMSVASFGSLADSFDDAIGQPPNLLGTAQNASGIEPSFVLNGVPIKQPRTGTRRPSSWAPATG
jgi:hypothetical protein